MCTALIAYQVFEKWPVFVASNRDEEHGRDFDAPQREARNGLEVLAPRDRLAGGTWIGINDLPLFAILTNRTDTLPRDTLPSDLAQKTRSRGLLVRDVLGASSLDEALDIVEATVDLTRASFNLLVGDSEQLFVVEKIPGTLRLEPLEPGIHVISNGGQVNDRDVGEVAHAFELWYDLSLPGADPWKIGPQLLAADEARGELPPLYKRTRPRGTVCSTLLGIDASGTARLDYSAAPPGEQPYARYMMEAHG